MTKKSRTNAFFLCQNDKNVWKIYVNNENNYLTKQCEIWYKKIHYALKKHAQGWKLKEMHAKYIKVIDNFVQMDYYTQEENFTVERVQLKTSPKLR